jgi:hypothetical protein
VVAIIGAVSRSQDARAEEEGAMTGSEGHRECISLEKLQQ